MLRERNAGTYLLSSYFFSKIIGEIIFQIINPIIFACIIYYNIGYQSDISKFFIFMILTSIFAILISNIISCICVSIDLSTFVLVLIFVISILYAGWFISPKLLFEYPNWKFANIISYIKYAFVGISLN